MKYSQFVFPAICAAFSAVMFAMLYWLIIVSTVTPPYFAGLLLLVPVIVFSALAVTAYRSKSSTVAVNTVTAVLIPVFAVLSVILFIYVGFSEAVEPCDDPRYYTRVYNTYGDGSLVAEVFPERIPDGAENVRFHYHGAFLQGGGEFSLAYGDDPASLEPVMAELEEKAVWHGGLSELGEWEDRPSYLRTDSSWGIFDIHDDATVYLIDYRNPYGEDEDGYDWWNHGEYIIASVSKESGEVLYRHCYW